MITKIIACFLVVAKISLGQTPSVPTDPAIQEKIAVLRADPELKGIQWEILQGANYQPFVFLVECPAGEREKQLTDVDRGFGLPVASMVNTWNKEWAEPMRLSGQAGATIPPFALLANYESYKKFAGKDLPPEGIVPPTLPYKGVTLSYFRGPDFESKLARRKAILAAASEQLISHYSPNAPEKRLSAWLALGLAMYIGEIQESSGGRKGSQMVRAESPSWRQDLTRAADALSAAGMAVPDFEEVLKLKSLGQAELAPMFRNYIRLFGYSLILYFKEKKSERFLPGFLNFVKSEFQGEGGIARLKSIFQADWKAIEKESGDFCELKISAPSPRASTSPEKAAPVKTLPQPFPLNLEPQSLPDLRAVMVQKIRGGKFPEVLALLKSEKIAQSKVFGPLREAELQLLEGPLALYKLFARQWKAGDKFPSGFGLSGEIVQCDEDSFEIRGKSGPARHPWISLSLRAVANHLYYTAKFNDAKTGLEVAASFLVSGDSSKVKNFLKSLTEKGIPAEKAEALSMLVPAFEAATKEANAREVVEKLAAVDPQEGLAAIRKLASTPELRETATYLQTKPFLLGFAVQGLLQQFEKLGVSTLFRGKCSPSSDGTIVLHYKFANIEELQDWKSGPSAYFDGYLGKKKTDPAGIWNIENGHLSVTPWGGFFHKARWTGDLSFEFVVETGSGEDEKAVKNMPQLLAGFYDELGNFVYCWNFGRANSVSAKGKSVLSEPETPWYPEREYKMLLVQRGDRFSVLRDDEEKGTVESKGLRGGWAFFYASGGMTYRLASATIRGQLHPEFLESSKTDWVRKELEEIFRKIP